MGLFDNSLKEGESLIRYPEMLEHDYLPKLLPYRDNQQMYISDCIKPLLQGRNGKCLLITGAPGIGKTAATKYVLRELDEKGLDDQVIPIYINVWKKNTTHKVILDICDQIGFKFTHNRTSDDLLREITRIINKKTTAIVLDEADKIEDQQIYYMLSEELAKKTLILITNEKRWLAEIDQRIKSRLNPEVLEFKPYNLEETRGILKERVEQALVPGVLDKDAFDLMVQKAYSTNDIRTGLFLLKESAELAEAESSKKIHLKHANKAIDKLKTFTIKSSADLQTDKRDLLTVIKENSGKTIGEIHKLFGEPPYSTFHRKIKELEAGKFITLKEISGEGHSGKTSQVFYGQQGKTLQDF